MDGGDFNAEHHPFIIDGLVTLQKLVYRLVDCLRNSSLYYMAHPDIRIVHPLTPEYLICCIIDCLNEPKM